MHHKTNPLVYYFVEELNPFRLFTEVSVEFNNNTLFIVCIFNFFSILMEAVGLPTMLSKQFIISLNIFYLI